jgi:tetratricopeptide (TPR) repeat protein
MAMDNPTLVERIGALISAGLISEETPGQYAFRHALMRQAVYANLLVKERKQYHRAIGETIVGLYGDSLDAHLSDLSHHFYEAGDWDKALEYARSAGARARAMYAPQEAVEHFTRASDAARHLPAPQLSSLFRERAHAYEISGDFERARADYESSLAEARANQDRRNEWEALIGLGFLWASRDYDRTGEYLKQALALARTIDDRSVLGHTLNRVGNWYLNVEAADQARRLHHEALTIFQQLDDASGIAETADLLGLANMLAGNWKEGGDFYRQAIALFRSLNDRRGLSSVLANQAQRGAMVFNDLLIPSDDEHAMTITEAEEALRLSREIGWRAGEVYALCVLGSLFGSRGDYDRSFDLLTRSLQMAEEIRHGQWATLGQLQMGTLYLNLLELDRAQQHLEQSLASAREVRSTNFIDELIALVATVLIRKGDRRSLERAEQILQPIPKADVSMASLGQRACGYARIELALARGEYEQALDIVSLLASQLAESAPSAVAAHLRLHQAQALAALHRLGESETVLKDLQHRLPAKSTRPFLWRVHVALGDVYRRQKRHDESNAQFAEASKVIEELAANVSDQVLRDNFRRNAYAGIPAASRPAPKRRQTAARTAKASSKDKTRARKSARGS